MGKRWGVLVAAVVLASAGLGSSAEALPLDGGTGPMVGAGTYMPGLTATPSSQQWTFSGTWVAVLSAGTAIDTDGPLQCSLTGDSTVGETATFGEGRGSLWCGHVGSSDATLQCTVAYERVGPTFVWTSVGGCVVSVFDGVGFHQATTSVEGVFLYQFTNTLPPWTNYEIEGELSTF